MQSGSVSRLNSAVLPKALAAVSIALGMVTAGTSAEAALVTTTPQIGTFLAALSGNAPFTAPASVTLAVSFNEFDASLGTLQQVVFRWDTALSARLNDSGWDDGAFGDPAPRIDASVGAEVVGLGQLFGNDFTASVPDGGVSATITQSVTGTRTYSAPADLAHFIGTSSFSTQVKLDVTVVTDNDSASMTSSWQTTPRTGLFSVEYVYEVAGVSVPEPGVLFLGAAAALAFGFAGSRHRRSAR